MLVVSDTSAITNLIQVNLLEILYQLYGQVIIPTAVYDELSEIAAQKAIIDATAWIHIEIAKNQNLIIQLQKDLDIGESESIVLALELKSDFLIIDEQKGRKVAETMGIKVVGLLGTLLKAKQKGLISSLKPILDELTNQVGFHISPVLYQHVLHLANEIRL